MLKYRYLLMCYVFICCNRVNYRRFVMTAIYNDRETRVTFLLLLSLITAVCD